MKKLLKNTASVLKLTYLLIGKKHYKHTKRLFPLFIIFFFVSCTQKSFVCWNERETEAVAFAFDEVLQCVTVRDIHNYSALSARREPLNSDMPGGTHTLQMDENLIILEVIQDTVLVKTRLPSGELTTDPSRIDNEYDYLNQRRYHAVFPITHKYVFDKQMSRLSLFYSLLPKPRSAIEQEFIYDKARDGLYPRKVKDLTLEESSMIFPAHEKSSVFLYPKCKEDTYSLKRILRTIIRTLTFA